MTDRTERKRLVDRVLMDRRFCGDENHKTLADGVVALIAENKRLAANVKLNLCDHPAIHQGDVDLLVAFVTGTSQMELAKVHGCTPPNISRKIRRVKDRLGWREGMLVSEIRDRAERLRALASQGAFVTADLMSERDQLRAEVAGLKTGYEAYERVNAELKAENEALRKDAVKWEIVKRAGDQLLADEGRAAIWSACSRILISVASELNSGRSVVTEEGVTKGGVEIGDWRVTVERIGAAFGKGEQS